MISVGAAFYRAKQSIAGLYDDREAASIAHELLEAVTGMGRLERLMEKDRMLSGEQEIFFDQAIAGLRSGRPLQQVLGFAWFCGLKIGVSADVLIPRPETEELVQWILSDYRDAPGLPVLDLCTGSGCIALALKSARPGFEVSGCDLSVPALRQARQNAQELGLSVSFFEQNVLTETPAGNYRIMVSNPPYIPVRERAGMDRVVTGHEPHLALFVPDEDPLLFYKALARCAQRALVPGGALYCELHRDYGEAVMEVWKEAGFRNLELRRDLSSNERMTKCIKP